MFRMTFLCKEKVAVDGSLAGKDLSNVEVTVSSHEGLVYVEVGGVALKLTQRQASDMKFALNKAVYEAKLQKGGER